VLGEIRSPDLRFRGSMRISPDCSFSRNPGASHRPSVVCERHRHAEAPLLVLPLRPAQAALFVGLSVACATDDVQVRLEPASGNHSARSALGSLQPVCNPFWLALQPVCNPEASEPPRTRANSVPRKPHFSGSFACVCWGSRKLVVSGRQDLNLRPPGPQPEILRIAPFMKWPICRRFVRLGVFQ
jgi:hypothetical protein